MKTMVKNYSRVFQIKDFSNSILSEHFSLRKLKGKEIDNMFQKFHAKYL